jgi:mRNA interferase HigB
MRVIGYEAIQDFVKAHRDAESSLSAWYMTTNDALWKSIVDVRQTYPHADAVGTCTVFNIRGNRYRLIAKIDYAKEAIFIASILTHADYDKEKWKRDCGG